MSPTDAAPPTALASRWPRPLIATAAVGLLLAAFVISTVRNPGVHALSPAAAVVAAGRAHLYILLPAALLIALFCARRGVERGFALETGVWPGLLCFGGWMLVVAWSGTVSRIVDADAPAFGLFLLACFAIQRGDPPAPTRTGFGWTLAAGALGALSVGGTMDALDGIGALAFYAGWSAGWRRALGFAISAMVVGGIIAGRAIWTNGLAAFVHDVRLPSEFPWVHAAAFLAVALLCHALARRMPFHGVQPGGSSPEHLPAASAYRVIGCVLFVTAMDVPAAIFGTTKGGAMLDHWMFVGIPFSVVASLVVTDLFPAQYRTSR